MKAVTRILAVSIAVSGCGGDDSPAPVELSIEPPTQVVNNQVVLKGSSFVPAGSTCPQTGDFIRIGSLGVHAITYVNATTGTSGSASDDLWVCNSEDGRKMHWTSKPIALVPGDNAITVTMTAPGRSSSASVVVRGQG
jgi:hypothetical protein